MTDSISAARTLSGRHLRRLNTRLFHEGAIYLKEAKRIHRSVLRILMMGCLALFALVCKSRAPWESSVAFTNKRGEIENPGNLSRSHGMFHKSVGVGLTRVRLNKKIM